MNKWEEKKQKAIKENNVIVYNSMIAYEKYGDAGVLIDAIDHQQEELNQLSDLYDKVFEHREKLINENYELIQDRNMWIDASQIQSKQIQQLEQENALLKAGAKQDEVITYTTTGNFILDNTKISR